ncbi:MAG: DinB family protein [Actinomycetota bacterium]
MDRCEECGYAYDALDHGELSATVRGFGPRYAAAINRDDAALRAHPIGGTWSILEYACHFRDVLRTQRDRVALALTEDEPTFPSMRREERAVEERYNEQDPVRVTSELTTAADGFADAIDDLDEAGWQRTGVYSWPGKRVRTLDWVARHTIHEGEHHLMDIERLAGALT